MNCPYADDDGAYVLGALDPTEQQRYRAHLGDCARCRGAVEELAAMPGYLARLLPSAEAAEPRFRPGGALEPGTPPDLLPRLVEQVRARRRVARWRAAAVGVVTIAVVVTGTAVTTTAVTTAAQPNDGSAATVPDEQAAVPDDQATVPDDRATLVAMSAEPGVPVEATLLVTGRGWGTSIDTRCRYDGASGGQSDGTTYLLYAIDDAGGESLVSSWRQVPGREVTVPGSTGLDLSDIDRVEVRLETGETILQTRL